MATDAVAAVLRGLNEEQVAAVTAPTTAPFMVLAGPGSGKTRVLTARAAYLAAAAGVPPSSMLAVTFTNKAAAEMGERLGRLLAPQGEDARDSGGGGDGGGAGGDDGDGGGGSGSGASTRQRAPRGATVATLHSMACRWLRQYGSAIGVPPTYAVLAADDSRRLVAAVVKDAGLDPLVVRPRAVAAAISYAKNVSPLGDGGQDGWLAAIPKTLPQGRSLATAYWARCRELVALDFDDLLLAARWLLWAAPDVRAALQARYRHVLVDEWQDLNVVQYDILRLLASPAMQVARGGGGGGGALPAPPSTFCVGDFDQLLYSWRGARAENGTTFPADFGTPAAPVARFELSANYRSTGVITAVGSALIAGNPGRGGRAPMRSIRGVSPSTPRVVVVPASDARTEAAYVVARARGLVRSGEVPSYGSIAVMYRSNVASRALEEALVAGGDVPYRLTGGVRFYERREVRDLCAYLRLASSTADGVAFARVVNVPPRRIGDKTLEALDAYAASAGDGGTPVGAAHAVRLLVAAAAAGEAVPLRKAAVAQLGSFVAVIDGLTVAAAAGASVGDLLDQTLAAVGYQEYLATAPFPDVKGVSDGEARQQRWANVLELRSVAHEATSLADFLDEAALMAGDTPDDTATAGSGGASTPRLSLMTLHASKGLEFEAVFLVGLEEGSLPAYSAIVAAGDGQSGGLEEERRLAYVGVTRARTRLYLCFKRRRMTVVRGGAAPGDMDGDASDPDGGGGGGSRMVMLPTEPSRFLAFVRCPVRERGLIMRVDAASGEMDVYWLRSASTETMGVGGRQGLTLTR